MRRIILMVLFCHIYSCLLGQSFFDWKQCKTEDDFVEYFTQNIQSLDSLEGIYIARAEIIQKSPSFDEKKVAGGDLNIVIVKDHIGNFLTYYFDGKGIPHEYKLKFKKAGSNCYNFNFSFSPSSAFPSGISVKQNFIFNGYTFSVIREFSQEEKYELFENADRLKGSAIRVFYKFEAQKTFPTLEMYAQSAELKRQENEEKNSEWSGTGFALNGGYIATNFHVIDGAKNILIQGITDDFHEQYIADIVAADKHNDLAVLRVSDSRFKGFSQIPYKVSTSTSDVGESIFVLGYPLISTMGDEIKLTTGVISSKTGYQGDVTQYQISAPIQPGNSGGPLFDGKGNIIGIVSAKHKETENVGYAVKTSFLKTLIETFSNEAVLPNKNMVSELPLSNKVQKVKDFIFFIRCSAKAK